MKKLFLIILIILPLFSSFSTSWLSEINYDAKRENKFVYFLGNKNGDNTYNYFFVRIDRLKCVKNKNLYTKLIDASFNVPFSTRSPDFEYNFWVINIPQRELLKEKLHQICNIDESFFVRDLPYYDLNFDL